MGFTRIVSKPSRKRDRGKPSQWLTLFHREGTIVEKDGRRWELVSEQWGDIDYIKDWVEVTD